MQLVIELSDENVKRVLDGTWCGSQEITKGIPLPDNHGRLIDADAFEKSIIHDAKIEDKKDVIYALREYKSVLKGRSVSE